MVSTKKPAKPKLSDAEKTIVKWRKGGPALFAVEALGVPEKWDDILKSGVTTQQWESSKAIVAKRRVTIRSGHGTGKTTFLAWSVLWFMTCYYPCKIPCTAPTSHQLSDVLWSEIAKWLAVLRELLPKLAEEFAWTQEKFYLKSNPQESFAVARTARKENPEALQGFHCLSEDHEILTDKGWLGIDKISLKDKVLSVAINSEIAEYKPVDAINKYDFDGDINVLSGKSINMMITDEHRLPVRKRTGRRGGRSWNLKPVSELLKLGSFKIRRSSGWEGIDIEVPECFKKYGFSDLRFAEFIGFWIGDGGTRKHSDKGEFYEVILYQTKGDLSYVASLLSGTIYKHTADYFSFSDKDCANWLIDNCGRYQKYRSIPAEIMNSKPDIIESCLNGLWAADGSFVNGIKRQFYNTSKILIDQIQELTIKLGRPGTIGINVKSGSNKSCNGINFEAKNDCYTIGWIAIQPKETKIFTSNIKKEAYKGRVWCISTEYQTFWTRINGRVSLSGNSDNILFLIDEASGVAEKVFEVAEGALSTEGAFVIMAANPTREDGYFYESHHKSRANWACLHWNGEESELVSRRYVDDMKAKYGTDSPIYQVRVLGNFVTAVDGVIPLGLCIDAQNREVAIFSHAPVIWGLDVARFGDDSTALAKRQGNYQLEETQEWFGLDTMQTVGKIANLYRDAVVKPQQINVDVIGIGAGVVDRLAELGYPVAGVNVAESASHSQKYARLRDEIWFLGREWLEERDCKLQNDDALVAELTTAKYTVQSNGKIKVESKGEMKARGVASPNRADAFLLTFANIPISITDIDYNESYHDDGRSGWSGY